MYCKEHEAMVRFDSIEEGECKLCGELFSTVNSPPLNKFCFTCSEAFGVCEFCGREADEDE